MHEDGNDLNESGNTDTDIELALEKRDDELELPYHTKLGRISRPYDYTTKFPEIVHFQ